MKTQPDTKRIARNAEAVGAILCLLGAGWWVFTGTIESYPAALLFVGGAVLSLIGSAVVGDEATWMVRYR